MRCLFFFLFQSLTYVLHALIPLFQPPVDWELAFPEHHSQFVQVGFIGKGSTAFRPSINLATEEIDVDLKKYLKAVKQIHLAEPNTSWRDLGKFTTLAGEGRLTEITTTSPLGPVKMLQMILVQANTAYILTGAAIKDDFLQIQATLTQSFATFNLIPDLFSPLSQEKKQQFEDFFKTISSSLEPTTEMQNAQWSELQKRVLQNTSNMGSYWQFCVLKEGRNQIFQIKHSGNKEVRTQ